jgi:ferritin
MKPIVTSAMIALLNYRIQQEELSSRLYKAMAIYLNFNGFAGAAKLWEKYAAEETTHAQWTYDFLLDLDIQPTVPELSRPSDQFDGLIDICKKSYEHERQITEQCQALAKACLEQGDFLTFTLAEKLVKEQVEEISKTVYWLDRIEAFGTSKEALRLLDNEMGSI